MICVNCGNKCASRIRIRFDKKIGKLEECERCGTVGSAGVPDVYWPGHAYKSENITDRMGNPILLESRQHKANVMREQGISECGDRSHGTRIGAYKYAR